MTPGHVVSRYLRGGCLAYAIALKRELGLALYVLVDRHGGREDWVHAFVADPDRGVALDVRGTMPLDAAALAAGASVVGKISVRPATAKEISFRMDRYPTAREIDEARAVVRKFADYDPHDQLPARTVPFQGPR